MTQKKKWCACHGKPHSAADRPIAAAPCGRHGGVYHTGGSCVAELKRRVVYVKAVQDGSSLSNGVSDLGDGEPIVVNASSTKSKISGRHNQGENQKNEYAAAHYMTSAPVGMYNF